MKSVSWLLVFVSGFFALASAAPFAAGVFFPVVSLPVAALAAWRGVLLPGAWMLGFAVLGLAFSPITLKVLMSLWMFPAWMALCALAYLGGVLRHQRHQRHQRQGGVPDAG